MSNNFNYRKICPIIENLFTHQVSLNHRNNLNLFISHKNKFK